MIIVHLIFAGISFGPVANPFFGEYVRFAAGGFVFIAGLSVGAIFLPRVRDAHRRRPTYVALWRRAGVILIVHYLAEISFLMMWPLLGGVPADDVGWRLLDILALRAGYDLLPFYVVMVTLSPAMLEVVRLGWRWVLALLSIALFAVGQIDDYAWKFTPPNGQAFLPILWQVFYVLGLVAGSALPAYDALRQRTKFAALTVCLVGFMLLFVSCYAHDLHMDPIVPLTFSKLPLNAGEALRYFSMVGSILIGTDLVWRPRLKGSAFARFCERLGRNSLPVYVFHVWVVQVFAYLNYHGWAGPQGTWLLWVAVAAVGLTWLFAAGLERWRRWRAARARANESITQRLPAWMTWPGVRVGATAAALLSLVGMANAVVRQFGVPVQPGLPPAGQIDLELPQDYDPWEDNPDPVTDPAEKRRLHGLPPLETSDRGPATDAGNLTAPLG
jgi:hypothetical protein